MTSNVDAFEYANRSTPQTRRVLKQMLASRAQQGSLASVNLQGRAVLAGLSELA